MDKWNPCPFPTHPCSFTPNHATQTSHCAHATPPQAPTHLSEHTPRYRWTHAAHARSDAQPRTQIRPARSHAHGPHAHTPPLSPADPGSARGHAPPRPGVGDGPGPGPRPFPGPRRPNPAGPRPWPLTGAGRARLPAGREVRGAAAGRPERCVPHESAAPRPHARPLGSAAACAGRRALPPLPAAGPRRPLRSCALPPRRLGGARAAPSPRPDPSAFRAQSTTGDPLCAGPCPIGKIGKLRPKHTGSQAQQLPASRAVDT